MITVWAGRSDQGRVVVCVCWRKSETWALSAKLLFPRGLAAGGVTLGRVAGGVGSSRQVLTQVYM